MGLEGAGQQATGPGLPRGSLQSGLLDFLHLRLRRFLYQAKGSPAEYKAGLDLAIQSGWLWLHESGTYVKFTDAGAQLFA
jgi:hypothetical protein